MNQITKKISPYGTNRISAKVLGVRVDFISLKNALSLVEKWVKSNKQHQITTPNPEQIVLAQRDYGFKNIINQSALAICDGVGIVVAARLLRCKIYDLRLSGIDLMIGLCKLAAKKKWRVFLLGGKNNVAKKAAENLTRIILAACKDDPSSKLKIDFYHGTYNIQNETNKERREAIKKINDFQPQLLFVAYGAPWQEKWIDQNLVDLKVKVGMGVGGSFDYLAEKVKRAPKMLREMGLEWFWRLLHQPWRFRRQLALVKFIYLVVREKLFSKPVPQ